jgi:hypothetical protein
MNISGTINKLLYAIKMKGKDIKIDSRMYFSETSHRYVTKYIISEHKEVENRQHQLVLKWVSIYESYGKGNVLKFLAEYYKGM